MEINGGMILTGKTEEVGENLSLCHFYNRKYNMDWPVLRGDTDNTSVQKQSQISSVRVTYSAIFSFVFHNHGLLVSLLYRKLYIERHSIKSFVDGISLYLVLGQTQCRRKTSLCQNFSTTTKEVSGTIEQSTVLKPPLNRKKCPKAQAKTFCSIDQET
jgi:hypothetical protein